MIEDRRAAAAMRRLDILQAGQTARTGASSDPYLASWLNLLDPGREDLRTEVGIVVDVIPGGHAYKVSAGFRSFLWCSPGGTAGSFTTTGTRQINTIPIGSTAYFIRNPQSPMIGTIIAVEPNYMVGSPDQWPSDSIWPFIRTGQRSEPAHRWPVAEDARLAASRNLPLGSLDIPDFSAGRPMDSTSAGEWGQMAETGVGFFADSFQAYMRADEATGVFAFYIDQVLRVAGHNYQHNTSHREHEEIEDEGELSGWTRRTIYPWENYGVWRYNQVTPEWMVSSVVNYGYGAGQGTAPVDPLVVQGANGYAIREPAEYKGLPAARLLDWSGYLGQGGKSLISAPVQLNRYFGSVTAEQARTASSSAAVSRNDNIPSGRLGVGPPDGTPVYGGNPPICVVPSGSWDPGTKTYTAGKGTLTGAAAGMWASLYDANDVSAPPLGLIGVIVSVSGNSFTFSARSGKEIPARAANVVVYVWGTPPDGVIPFPGNYRGPKRPSVLSDPIIPQDQPGLLEEVRTLTGKLMFRSAAGIVLAKYPVIPTPRPNKLPQDPTGDRPATYAASGIPRTLDETPHKVKGAFYGDLDRPDYRACMVPDALAYAFNWQGLHPFAYHTDDWSVAQEQTYSGYMVNQKAPVYEDFQVQSYLAAPAPAYLDIDHRYNLTPYYENQSYFALLEDGGIVLSDGWGSEIRMTGGNIEFHCAGDFKIFNGRNLISWSGHDIDLKARDSVDIVAERYDLRTRAGRNHHHLAGNEGCGGFLFETKAVCPSYNFCDLVGESVTSSGFVVLTPNSQVWLRGQDVVLDLEPTHPEGRIVLNAGNEREIHTVSKNIAHKLPADGEIFHMFGTSGANSFTATVNTFSGMSIACTATSTSASALACGRIAAIKTVYAPQFDTTVFKPDGWEWEEFSHRNSTQYKSTDLNFWESRWTTIAKGSGQTPPVWQTVVVAGLRSATQSWAHPGSRWLEDGYGIHDYLIAKPDNYWLAIDRDVLRATYENPLSTHQFVKFDDEYRIPFNETLIIPSIVCTSPPPGPPGPPPPPPPPPSPPAPGDTLCCRDDLENALTDGTPVKLRSLNPGAVPPETCDLTNMGTGGIVTTWSWTAVGSAIGHASFPNASDGLDIWFVCTDEGFAWWAWNHADGNMGTEPPTYSAPVNLNNRCGRIFIADGTVSADPRIPKCSMLMVWGDFFEFG